MLLQRIDRFKANRHGVAAFHSIRGYRFPRMIVSGWLWIVFTLIAWVAGSAAFAAYLDRFSGYVTTYAGLASIMVAIVFLYIVSAIFILGGELNAAIRRYKEARQRVSG